MSKLLNAALNAGITAIQIGHFVLLFIFSALLIVYVGLLAFSYHLIAHEYDFC